ncbi:uncharacterized protein PRCAT00003913001 [Priceomyces carsonii]|uniref:uncharacterized protein n=1 Tax=Priceomyces carsonii TaxID=28549 RepID=UPI002EDAB218|nr:unnamed protein product [Priceomyces carsonii]
MQFLTAKSLLYVRVILLLVISFLLVKDPESLSTYGFILLLGKAMQVKLTILDPSNPLIGVLVTIIGTSAISDLIPLLADNIDYFETVVPTRLTGFFLLASFSYLAESQYFSTSLVFTYAFFEIWINFLIFNNLRDEKYYRLKKFVEENAEEIQELESRKVVPIVD